LIEANLIKVGNAHVTHTSAAGPLGVIVLTKIPVLSSSILVSSIANPKPRSPYTIKTANVKLHTSCWLVYYTGLRILAHKPF